MPSEKCMKDNRIPFRDALNDETLITTPRCQPQNKRFGLASFHQAVQSNALHTLHIINKTNLYCLIATSLGSNGFSRTQASSCLTQFRQAHSVRWSETEC